MSQKIVAIYGSHRKNGNSAYIVDRILSAVPDTEATVEKFHLASMNIHHCMGCFACRKTETCVHKDDFPALLDAILQADKIIISIPIFMFQAAGTVKQFLDRCYPLLLGAPGHYTNRMPPKDTVIVYSQGAPVDFAFKDYMAHNAKSFGLLGFNVIDSLICTGANPIGSAAENAELCARADEIGRSLLQ